MLVAQHTVYFPDAFLTQMREAMPSTLSFDDFLAACQRPLRRSIRVNTLKTSVADFLQLTAPYGWTLTPIPLKRRTKNAKAFHDKCENFSFRASNETDVLITAFYSLHGDHLGYG